MTRPPASIEADRRPADRIPAGSLPGPVDDGREVDARAAAIAEETGALGQTGQILARRAAAMSLRMERAEEHERVAAAARAQAAREAFDSARRSERNEPAVAEARHQAGVLASFDATVEGERARRHEAAAERSFHRALKAIAEHRAALAGLPEPAPTVATPPSAPIPVMPPASAQAKLGSSSPCVPISVKSSRFEALPPSLDDLIGVVGRPAPAPGSRAARRARPDPSRRAGGRR